MRAVTVATLAGLVLATGPVSAVDDADLLRLSHSVLRIEAPLPQGGFAMGSGVALSADTVITNCHVTRQARALSVVRGGVRYAVSGQLAAIERDLCLLEVPGLGATPAMLGSTRSLRIGGPVAALGFTGGIGLQRSRGEVMSLHRYQGATVIRSSTWFNSGASGGALFSDAGDLVGLLTFRLRGGLAHYYAAPAEWIGELQARARSNGFPEVAPLNGPAVPYWQLPPEQQPRFLQAASLGLARRWAQVADLAADWLRADVRDAEAWRALSDALSYTGSPQQAGSAMACAVALERAAERAPTAEAAAASAVLLASPPPSSDLPAPCPVAS